LKGRYVYPPEELGKSAPWRKSRQVGAYDTTFPVMEIDPFVCNGLKFHTSI
jgi:hypothetical protein